LVGEQSGKRALEGTLHGHGDIIKTCLTELGCGGIRWIYFSEESDQLGALVSMVTNLEVS
jgi:hypothetical protein